MKRFDLYDTDNDSAAFDSRLNFVNVFIFILVNVVQVLRQMVDFRINDFIFLVDTLTVLIYNHAQNCWVQKVIDNDIYIANWI